MASLGSNCPEKLSVLNFQLLNERIHEMLVFKRKVGQSVMVGDMKVTVIRISPTEVILGFGGNNDVAVHRQEIYDRIKKESDAKTEKLPALS